MDKKKEVYLLTGSNIEPRIAFLRDARLEIANRIGDVVGQSAVYESIAWGFESNTNFLNQVLLVRSDLSADKILSEILKIEQNLGRIRVDRNYSSRTIDIDILYFGSEIIKSNDLIIPHPRLHERRFTLMPLAEISESFMHPVLHLTNKELLEQTKDSGEAWIFENENEI